MANPTTNYGFVLPTATDLVTDLPADFDVALQGVDTRLKALQPGTTLGDLAYSSATANTNTRLPVGTNGQVLAVVAGVPAWQNGTTGDIEGVTAGVGISGGGTSGTVTVTNSMATAITTAGDLIKGTGSGTFDRLGIGSTGQVLTVASGAPSWATPAAPSFSGVALLGNDPSISAATRTVLAWDSETFDTDGYHSNVTNNSRITIPSGKAGKYYISHGAYWNSGTTRTIVRILKNGTSQRDMQWFGNGSSEFGSVIFAYLDLAVGDYIQIDVYNTSGTLTYNTSGTCGFNAIYLGA